MNNFHGFKISKMSFNVNYVKGYRYLDRCGESMIQLEEALGPEWLPEEMKPTGGKLKNQTRQMVAEFDSGQLSVTQENFVDYEFFFSTACTINETLCDLWETEGIIGPVLRAISQKGFDSSEASEAFLIGMEYARPRNDFADILGNQSSNSFVYCSEDEIEWEGQSYPSRKRFHARALRQYKQQAFDQRLLSRIRLLPANQQTAVAALRNLRATVPDIPEFAAELDLEFMIEHEFRSRQFDTASFLDHTWRWIGNALSQLTKKGDLS